MDQLKQCVVAITGAGSGIGRALAHKFAQAGARLAISDLDAVGLEETEKIVAHLNAPVLVTLVDVSNQAAVVDWAQEVNGHYGTVNIIINNAGVALDSGDLLNTDIDDFKWLMDINLYGVLYGSKAFLPLLFDAEWGHVVNISSLFGLVAMQQQCAYNTSKFAVRGLTEALRMELEDSSSVHCTCVHPGGIKTKIAANSKLGKNASQALISNHSIAAERFDKIAHTSAELAAEKIVDAVLKKKKRLLIGTDARLMDIVQRLLPVRYSIISNWLTQKLI